MENANVPTYLLVDGENIDATLGMSVLGRRPHPEERPRWDRVVSYAGEVWGSGPVERQASDPASGAEGGTRGLFFLNATNGQMPMSFIQALLAMDIKPIPLAGTSNQKVVDIGIQRTMDAIVQRGAGNVLLVSHDGDYIPQVRALLEAGHRVGVLAFREFVNAELTALTSEGLEIHDLEDQVDAFNAVLPRVRIIPLESFDPFRYL